MSVYTAAPATGSNNSIQRRFALTASKFTVESKSGATEFSSEDAYAVKPENVVFGFAQHGDVKLVEMSEEQRAAVMTTFAVRRYGEVEQSIGVGQITSVRFKAPA